MGLAFLNGPTFGRMCSFRSTGSSAARITPAAAGACWWSASPPVAASRCQPGTACGHMASRTVGAYSYVRKQFGMSIGKFEGVQEALVCTAASPISWKGSSHDRRFPGFGSGTGHRHRDFQVPHDRDGPPGDG